MDSQQQKILANLPIQCSSEELPLVIRFMLEKRMNVRHLIPEFLAFAKETRDMELFRYVCSKSTPLDIRDFLRQHKVARKQKEIINYSFYNLSESTLSYYYAKYSVLAFQEIFDTTHPTPDKWRVGEWFQRACYGQAEIPESSLVSKLRSVRKSPDDKDKVLPELLQEGIPWHYLAQTFPVEKHLDVYIKYAHPRFILARLNEIISSPFLSLAVEKLQQSELLVNIAEILELTQYLTPANTPEKQQLRFSLLSLADKALKREFIDEQHVGKCAVLIDKSGSMRQAIELGVILAGIIATKTKADIYFFDHGVYFSPSPKNIAEVLAFQKIWKAKGGTNIIPVLQVITPHQYDTVVLVSDGFLNDWRYAISLIKSVPQNQRWFYVEIPKVLDREEPWANHLFQYLPSSLVKMRIESIKDYASIIAMLSYHNNPRISAALQGISEDLIAWADTPESERPLIKFREAIKCGNCGAPAPPEFSYCLWCGVPLTNTEA